MNIEEEILYCVFLYNRILIVVPLYVLSFSQIVLISHSQLFSFVFEEGKSLFSSIDYNSFKNLDVDVENR